MRYTRSLWCLAVVALAACAGTAPTQNDRSSATAPLPVPMENYLLLVMASPKVGMQEAFERWYAKHLIEFAQTPGVIAARRNTLVRTSSIGGPLPPSMAMYELEGSRIAEIDAEVGRRMQDGRIARGESVDYEGIVSIKARPLGPAMFARDVPGASPEEPLGQSGDVKEYQFIVFSDPTSPAVEQEFNDWYDRQHMPDVLRVPGFQFAQRFIVTSASANNRTARTFIIFNLKSRELAATNAEIVRRIREKITVPTTTMGNGTASFMEPAGPPEFATRRE